MENELEKTKTALILACIPLPPVFFVSPFILEGTVTILGWVEIGLFILLLMCWASRWGAPILISLALIALIAAWISGIVIAGMSFKRARVVEEITN